MSIQSCKNCSNQFTWKTISESIWYGFKPIKCENCGSQHYLPNIFRWIFAIAISFPLLIQTAIGSFVKPLIYFQIIWIFIITFVAPYLLRYYLNDKLVQ